MQKEHRRSEPRAASSDTLWAPGPLWLSKPVTGCGTPREEEVTLTEVLLARAMPGKGWELRLFAPQPRWLWGSPGPCTALVEEPGLGTNCSVKWRPEGTTEGRGLSQASRRRGPGQGVSGRAP